MNADTCHRHCRVRHEGWLVIALFFRLFYSTLPPTRSFSPDIHIRIRICPIYVENSISISRMCAERREGKGEKNADDDRNKFQIEPRE